jgi:3-phosphoshikimate 1-carboxyvinyltransferase
MSRSPATTLSVRQVRHIQGELSVPGDKSLSHRAVLLAALADGVTKITGFLPGEDCLCTMRALQAMGCVIEVVSETELRVHGTGGKLQPPLEPLECGNSGTAMRLIAGVLAAQPFKSRLIGDASLSSRPMKRIVDPLQKMGAKIQGRGEKHTAPLEIEGTQLTGIEYTMPVASAQLKSCLLLAGLFAQGTTSVTETTASRDHTERLLAHFHAPPIINASPDGKGRTVRVRGGSKLHAHDFHVPGDFSSAAFWITAAAALPGSSLALTNLGMNDTRTGLIGVLLRMGAHFNQMISGSTTEPTGMLQVYGRKLRGTKIEGAEIANVIDELPIIAVAGALAEGKTEIRDAKELRVKETDRIEAMAHNLRAFGVEVEEHEDGMTVHGGAALRGARVSSRGDHRIAMACAILGMFSRGETVIEDTACIATSYPTFQDDLPRIAHFHEGGLASLLSGRR